MNTTPRNKTAKMTNEFGNISMISGRASNSLGASTPLNVSMIETLEHDQTVDATYMDIEKILECLRTGSMIYR
jgi:hypothetical protein